jgi:hypothetical protein
LSRTSAGLAFAAVVVSRDRDVHAAESLDRHRPPSPPAGARRGRIISPRVVAGGALAGADGARLCDKRDHSRLLPEPCTRGRWGSTIGSQTLGKQTPTVTKASRCVTNTSVGAAQTAVLSNAPRGPCGA